ncbi:MAG: S-adenosylmethionine:tRNA ribosyltransferase-isomerase [Bacteroidota bacterium]
MPIPEYINIADFNYELPADRIAQRPLSMRDASRLLVYRNGEISDNHFASIASVIPRGSLMVFNDTKVVRARLRFAKSSGGMIEIFCLEPMTPTANLQLAFTQTFSCTWNCLVGNSKKWKDEVLIKPLGEPGTWLKAERKANLGDGCFEIGFSWEPSSKTFSEILEVAGKVPLPPYIHRDSDEDDASRYQTMFASNEGSVAAPTAGLHFTGTTIENLLKHDCRIDKVTLHVGLGTFRPVSVADIREHRMHSELINVSLSTLKNLRNSIDHPLIAVGTTSARTLESLYWMGVKALQHPQSVINKVEQWEPYETDSSFLPTTAESLDALILHLASRNLKEIWGSTCLIIVPGYKFRLVTGLVTNFHMPQSTLLLLVAAFAGNGWKDVYKHALDKGYRFLSYGDACIFLQK